MDWSRELSQVRLHVERTIGVLKQKFTILQGTIYFHYILVTDNTGQNMVTIDKIIRACCALVNLYPSVIPQH